ncbi:MAG: VOC family protein [Acidimicrobiales bacterium]
MFAIGKCFHLAHLVEDLDAVDRWYDDLFSCVRFYKAYEKAAMRTASLLVISDMIMEPIQPSSDAAHQDTPLAKFKARFGNRLHSIAWYVDDVKELSASLLEHGVRQVGLTGKPVKDPKKAVAIWTHPRDTHALLEFCEPGFAADPRLEPSWSAAMWRDEHPLGIERTSHITVLFDDLDDAAQTYGHALQGRLLHEEETAARRSAFYAVGEETVVEAVKPLTADSPEGRDFAQAGEGVFSLTFATNDLARAASFLREKNQRLEGESSNEFWVNRDDAFGLRVAFTDRRIPGDARA